VTQGNGLVGDHHGRGWPTADATASAQRSAILDIACTTGWLDPGEEAKNLTWVRTFYRDLFADTGGVPVPGEAYDGAVATYERVGKQYAQQGFALKAIAVYKQIREIIAKHVPQLEERYAHGIVTTTLVPPHSPSPTHSSPPSARARSRRRAARVAAVECS